MKALFVGNKYAGYVKFYAWFKCLHIDKFEDNNRKKTNCICLQFMKLPVLLIDNIEKYVVMH